MVQKCSISSDITQKIASRPWRLDAIMEGIPGPSNWIKDKNGGKIDGKIWEHNVSSYPRQQVDRLMKQRTTRVTGRGIQRNTYSETEITLRDRCTQTHIKTCTHMLQKVISVVTHTETAREMIVELANTHVSSVRLTYEILTVAQRCNIV